MRILVSNGRIIDPSRGFDGNGSVLIEDGRIKASGERVSAASVRADTIVDASGKLIIPALVDMHCHLREPGREDEETIETGSRSACRGGFSHICCMPNTDPPVDSEGIVQLILSRAAACGTVNVLPVACITKRREGKELAEMARLKAAGAVAFSDDGSHVTDTSVMRAALSYSKMISGLVISHCEDSFLAGGGVMHEGFVSTMLGMPSIPALSEEIAVARDIMLAEETGGRLHIAHVSTAGAVEAVRLAKARGLNVSCETCPHYFSLTDEAVTGFDTNMKMKPPLRSAEHVEAVKQGLRDGTIDAIATDHAPHSSAEKELEFCEAAFGVVGFETAFAAGVTHLVEPGILQMRELVALMSTRPAKILGVEAGTLSEGSPANVAVIDAEKEWEVTREGLVSKSKNSCFIGRKLRGVVEHLIVSGKVVMEVKTR